MAKGYGMVVVTMTYAARRHPDRDAFWPLKRTEIACISLEWSSSGVGGCPPTGQAMPWHTNGSGLESPGIGRMAPPGEEWELH